MNELDHFLDIATKAAIKGGIVLKDFWGKQLAIATKNRIDDLVTEADQGAEKEILKIITSNFPQHGILAEETGQLGAIESDFLWAIDPLDGTTNYAHSYPHCAVSIALLKQGIPIVGIVYNPITEELWRAATGKGATLNEKPIKVSATSELNQSLLVTGFAYDRRETKDNNYAEFCHLTHLTQGVRRSGSASLDLAQVACGRFDGYWERGLKCWDIAAGIVIVREAGGNVTAYNQETIDLNSGRILATNGKIHSCLSEVLLQIKPLEEFDQILFE